MRDIAPLFAEVADKEPAVSIYWCTAAALSLVAFVLRRFHPLASMSVLPFAAIWAIGSLEGSLLDPFVGPALLQELGTAYVVQASAALVLPFIAVAVSVGRPPPAAQKTQAGSAV